MPCNTLLLLAIFGCAPCSEAERVRDDSVTLLDVYTRSAKGASMLTEADIDGACHGLPEHTPSFEEFVKKYDRSYSGDAEYKRRLALYEGRVATIRKQNCRADSWTATVNHLSDRSPEELSQLHGWKGAAKDHAGGGAFSFLQTEASTSDSWRFDYRRFMRRQEHEVRHDDVDEGNVNQEFRHEERRTPEGPVANKRDWRGLVSTTTPFQQGECGSCWAFATATVLGAHSELYGEKRTFSPQHLIQCVVNDRKCGGSGGCDGATVELGLEHVLKHGLATDEDLPYTGLEAECFDGPSPHVTGHKKKVKIEDVFSNLAALLEKKHHVTQLAQSGTKTKTVQARGAQGLIGWKNPLHNNYHALLRALQDGPVAVALQAMDSWYTYGGGIVGDDCPAAATINHATVLVGYGEESPSKQYWIIQNSWGPGWGENGFLRLKRRGQDEEKYCGWDAAPEVGNGCQNGPSKVWVCGTCGILYDPVRPVFQQ